MIEKSNVAGRTGGLDGCRVLIVEDEYLVAHDLEQELKSLGATIVGPIAGFAEAEDHIANDGFDVAVIDLNLRGRLACSLGDKLLRRQIPFVFVTGYEAKTITDRFRNVKRWGKPRTI